MLRDRPGYQQQGFVPPSPSSSPTSSTASRCCAIRRGMRRKNGRKIWLCCCCYCPSSSTSFITSIGVFILVLGYALLGAFIFMALEGGFNSRPIELVDQFESREQLDKKQITNDEIRSQTVEKLWSITEDLNILYKENWTRLAAQEVLKFQQSIVKSLSNYGNSVTIKSGDIKGTSAVYYTQHQHQWSFASSFLYSLTLITTIGKSSARHKNSRPRGVCIVFPAVSAPV
ncbi:UNVERIFIED_CONTAM: hypothetical protein PYX00_009150 [Menopon gallinae]|uniref:Uncharacterized protein n=1 Tax=Menopon gallinae TaxID=328185 RepID=A0AAW2HAU0_9NEOP